MYHSQLNPQSLLSEGSTCMSVNISISYMSFDQHSMRILLTAKAFVYPNHKRKHNWTFESNNESDLIKLLTSHFVFHHVSVCAKPMWIVTTAVPIYYYQIKPMLMCCGLERPAPSHALEERLPMFQNWQRSGSSSGCPNTH